MSGERSLQVVAAGQVRVNQSARETLCDRWTGLNLELCLKSGVGGGDTLLVCSFHSFTVAKFETNLLSVDL